MEKLLLLSFFFVYATIGSRDTDNIRYSGHESTKVIEKFLFEYSEKQSLTFPGNTWYVLRNSATPAFFTEIYKVNGDTIIEDQTWKIISFKTDTASVGDNGWKTKLYLLEEDGQIYCALPDKLSPKLYFDFSAEVNDSLALYNPYSKMFTNVVIKEINHLEINGLQRKQYLVHNAIPDMKIMGQDEAWAWPEIWIEGIGSMNGIYYGNNPGIIGVQFDLKCFLQDGVIVYPEGFEGECYQTTLKMEDVILQNEIQVYPNPFQNLLHIKLPGNRKTQSVSLMNLNGKVVYKQNINGSIEQLTIPTTNIQTGIHLFHIRMGENCYYFKIIKLK